jgi:hypothetical protein
MDADTKAELDAEGNTAALVNYYNDFRVNAGNSAVLKRDCATLRGWLQSDGETQTTPTPIPSPPTGAVDKSGTIQDTQASGYVADVTLSVHSPIAATPAELPDGCAQFAPVVAGTQTVEWLVEVSGSVKYPAVNGIQWPANDAFLLNFADPQTVDAFTCTGADTLRAVTGTTDVGPTVFSLTNPGTAQDFVLYMVYPVDKTPNDPKAAFPGSGAYVGPFGGGACTVGGNLPTPSNGGCDVSVY